MTNHESGANLTPSDIAESLHPESPHEYVADALAYALKCEAEIKRLREGVESVLSEFAMDMGYAAIDLRELLNSQP